MLNPFKKINTDDRVVNQMQDNVDRSLSPVLRLAILDGRILSNQVVSGSTSISHGLGRKPIGYLVISSSAQAVFSDNIPNSTDLSFTLASSTPTTVSLWVF